MNTELELYWTEVMAEQEREAHKARVAVERENTRKRLDAIIDARRQQVEREWQAGERHEHTIRPRADERGGALDNDWYGTTTSDNELYSGTGQA